MAKGSVVWFEVAGQDADNLQQFYGELFGWSFRKDGPPGYGIVDGTEGSIPGGVGAMPGGASWTTFYVEVEDVPASLAAAEARGGQVLMPATTMPNMVLGVFADPEGHPVGVYAAA